MDDLERIQKHHGGPHAGPNVPRGTPWRRLHRSPFFWIAAFFILLAMVIFVTTDGFLLRPARTAVSGP
jgi:hypothetical protein